MREPGSIPNSTTFHLEKVLTEDSRGSLVCMHPFEARVLGVPFPDGQMRLRSEWTRLPFIHACSVARAHLCLTLPLGHCLPTVKNPWDHCGVMDAGVGTRWGVRGGKEVLQEEVMLPEELSRGRSKALAFQAEKKSMQSYRAGRGRSWPRFRGGGSVSLTSEVCCHCG